jgi:UDP-glucose 6-dehydrogenase
MNVKAIDFKNWCMDNISSLAWSRLVLNVLPELRQLDHNLSDIENPSDQVILGEKELEALEKAMQALYKMELPHEVVSA